MKKLLFILIMCLFFLPMLQQKYEFIEEEDLSGEFTLVEEPDSFKTNWFNSKYQTQYDSYFNDGLGFHNSLTRLYNQIQFVLFKKININVGLVTENGVLLTPRDIKTTLGEDFVGKDLIQQKVNDIEWVKKKMEQEGKKLLIVLAPNKARYYEDEIPKYFKKSDTTNYDLFLELFEKSEIDYIDFNAWFLEQKTESKHNLIPKYGVHWSNYGSFLAADSILKYCNNYFKYNLPIYIEDSLLVTTKPREPDYDMGKALNLLTSLNDEKYVYPYSRVEAGVASKKKGLLVVSDSFFYNIFDSEFVSKVFDLKGFWYYNRDVKLKGSSRLKRSDDLEKVLPKADLIIIMQTEWNLNRLGFGIVDELKAHYLGVKLTKMEQEINYYLSRIRSEKEWYKKIKDQALLEKKPIDSVLLTHATHMAKKKLEK